MLQSLTVLNGELTPSFEEYNDTYTVQVNSDVFSLELDYTVTESANVNIYGNENFVEGENKVLIEVMDSEGNLTEYNLSVMKKKVQTTNNILKEPIPVEVKKELPGYVAPLIALICFTLILFTFWLLFLKRKHKKKSL